MYKILEKNTNGHKVNILYSPELERKNINKYLCCYAIIDNNSMIETEYIPSSYQQIDDIDLINKHAGFKFNYDGQKIILTINDVQEEEFLEKKSHYWWLENTMKNFVIKFYVSFENETAIHFAVDEEEIKKTGRNYKTLLLTVQAVTEEKAIKKVLNINYENTHPEIYGDDKYSIEDLKKYYDAYCIA